MYYFVFTLPTHQWFITWRTLWTLVNHIDFFCYQTKLIAFFPPNRGGTMNFKMRAMQTDHLFIVGNAFRILATSSCWFAFTSCVWLIEPREKWNKPLELHALSPKRSTSLASCWLFCGGLKPKASCNSISSLGEKKISFGRMHMRYDVFIFFFFIRGENCIWLEGWRV